MLPQDDMDLLDRILESDYKNVAKPDWPEFDVLKKSDRIPPLIQLRLRSMLLETQSKREKASKFCAWAFHGREYRLFGRKNMMRCCNKAPEELENIKSALLNGIETPECNNCWPLEKVGISSQRLVMNFTLDQALDTDVIHLYDRALETKDHARYLYKIEVSNLCNSTCMTCGSRGSTAWAALERKNGQPSAPFIQMKVTDRGVIHDFWDGKTGEDAHLEIDYVRAKSINFFGGESTLNKPNYEILQKLIDNGNMDCEIAFTTHGNFSFDPDQLDLLRRFKNLHFNFSIDGTNKVYEYIRFPLSWEKLRENMLWCKTNNIKFSANWTVSNLNIFYYDLLKSWFSNNYVRHSTTLASSNYKHRENPLEKANKEWQITSLSRRVKDRIIEQNWSQEVKALLTPHDADDDRHYETFLKEIIRQDTWKNISIFDYMPEFAAVIAEDLARVS